MRLPRPIHVTPGIPKPYQSEPPNQWVFRVLNLPIPGPNDVSPWYLTDLGCHTICLYDESSRTKPVQELRIRPERQIAIEAWIRRQLAPTEDMQKRAIVIVLADPSRQMFILQIKDDEHPIEEVRGKRSLLSATRVKGETIPETVHRNLYQELIDPCVADDILSRMFPLPQKLMFSPRLNTMMLYAWYVAIAESERHFMYWSEKVLREPGVTEAVPTCLSVHEVKALASQEKSEPGYAFVSSQHELLLEVSSEI